MLLIQFLPTDRDGGISIPPLNMGESEFAHPASQPILARSEKTNVRFERTKVRSERTKVQSKKTNIRFERTKARSERTKV